MIQSNFTVKAWATRSHAIYAGCKNFLVFVSVGHLYKLKLSPQRHREHGVSRPAWAHRRQVNEKEININLLKNNLIPTTNM